MSWNEALPCPFCGNTELIVSEIVAPQNSTRFPETVVCGQCGTCGPWGDNENAAISKWNKRRGDASETALIVGLQSKITHLLADVKAAHSVLQEVQGCENNGKPKLCDGCLISINRLMGATVKTV